MQPPSDKGRRLKIYYITQASTKPPTFVAFVNRKELFHFSYQRYLENQIRETFDLQGTPIRFIVRGAGQKRYLIWRIRDRKDHRYGTFSADTVGCSGGGAGPTWWGASILPSLYPSCSPKSDIRDYGSGNAGMTNVLGTFESCRPSSRLWAISAKGIIADVARTSDYPLRRRATDVFYADYLMALLALLGHCFSFLRI